jgi:hypothetical protein
LDVHSDDGLPQSRDTLIKGRDRTVIEPG